MGYTKPLVKAAGTALQTGAEKVLRNLPVEQADFIAKTLNFKTGSPEDIFIRGGGLHPTDGPGIINSIQRGEAQDLGQHITNAVQGEPAALNEIGRFSDNGTNQVTEDTIKANGLKQANNVKNTTTEISAADKQVADEMIQSPEGQKFLADQEATKQDYLSQYQTHVKRAELGYSRTDPEKFAHEGRFTKAKARVERAQRDNTSTAYAKFIEDQLGDPLRAQKGYGIKASKKFPDRKGSKGFKPNNKDLETGIKYEEYLEQHHLLFNAEGSAFAKQKVFKQDPSFLVATQRYIAKRYDSAFGEAAQNMANIPSDQVHKPYHAWLRELKLDGVSGSNYEQYWKQKFKDNPNMTPQEIQDAIDEWFEEIIYPSVVMLDDWMKKADLSKVNQAEISFPDKLLKQAKASIQNEMNPIKPTAAPGSTAYDVQMDDIHTRANRGEFGPGQRSWFKDSKARKDAAKTLQ